MHVGDLSRPGFTIEQAPRYDLEDWQAEAFAELLMSGFEPGAL
jgi:hypothetical protein